MYSNLVNNLARNRVGGPGKLPLASKILAAHSAGVDESPYLRLRPGAFVFSRGPWDSTSYYPDIKGWN